MREEIGRAESRFGGGAAAEKAERGGWCEFELVVVAAVAVEGETIRSELLTVAAVEEVVMKCAELGLALKAEEKIFAGREFAAGEKEVMVLAGAVVMEVTVHSELAIVAVFAAEVVMM